MTNRSDSSKEVTRDGNPRNVYKIDRKKAAETFLKLEDPLIESEKRWKQFEKDALDRWPWLKDITNPGQEAKKRTKKRTRLAAKGGKIMVGYKAGGKV